MAKMEKPRPCPICGVTEDEYNPHGKLECIPGLVAEVARFNLQKSEWEKAANEERDRADHNFKNCKKLESKLEESNRLNGELVALLRKVDAIFENPKIVMGTYTVVLEVPSDVAFGIKAAIAEADKTTPLNPLGEGSCHSCIDCETINTPHKCGCHETLTEKRKDVADDGPGHKCDVCGVVKQDTFETCRDCYMAT